MQAAIDKLQLLEKSTDQPYKQLLRKIYRASSELISLKN